ncbi:MAG TPA: hypothetical protein VL485_08355 [Ktedonobacteraceae bacterium]|nr:hypothetical protein [Ktedonobacteraceae bacterium]
MSYYPPQEPQRQQSQDPYPPYNPYDPQYSQSTFVSQPSYTNNQPGGPQGKVMPGHNKTAAAQLWRTLLQFFGKRGLLAVGGALLAVIAFFLPYYSSYSAYFLASQTLDDKWWLELALAAFPLAILLALRTIPRVKLQRRRWSLLVLGSGVLGLLLNYWFMDMTIGTGYWRFGTWAYFVGMALVALAGLLLSLTKE